MTVVHPSARCSRTNTSENAEHVSKYSVSLWVIVVVVRLVMRAGWTGLDWFIRPEPGEMGKDSNRLDLLRLPGRN